MKILYFTDSHIRGNNPTNRIDVFVDSLEDKFNEIVNIINDEKVDFVLHGGDIFDRPDVSISVVNRFVKILNKINVPIYLIAGNHDIYGHNPETINRTVLSLLNIIDLLNIVDSNEKIILEKNDLKVQLTGQPYVYDIDSNNDKLKYYSPKNIEDGVDYSIHMVHGMLLDKPFIKGVPHTLLDDIKDTKANITLAGHYHGGFKTAEINDKFFVNPGSLVRISNSMMEINRKPKVVLIELGKKINIKDIYLKNIKSGEEVLDREKLEQSVFKGERMYEFKQTIDSAMNFEKMDINELIMEVSNATGVEDIVRKEAIRRIAEIQMKGLEN